MDIAEAFARPQLRQKEEGEETSQGITQEEPQMNPTQSDPITEPKEVNCEKCGSGDVRVYHRKGRKPKRICRPCERKRQRQYVRAPRPYTGKYYPSMLAYKKRHPERERARQRVARLVRVGKLIRPNSCPKCGISTKVEAHHEDYTKPEQVNWMCKKCHGVEHRYE